jgi:MFS family permease
MLPRLDANFTRFYLAALTSNVGDGVVRAALSLYAATLTRDPVYSSGRGGFRTAPLVAVLVSGALADRPNCRRLMVRVNVVRALLLALLAGAAATGLESIWLLFSVVFLLGVAETLFDTASAAFVPHIVGRKALPQANGRLFSAQVLANDFAGPPLGGLLFTLAPFLPLLVDGVSFFVAAALVATLSGSFAPVPRTGVRTHLGAGILEGLRWVLGSRLLLTLGIVVALLGFGNQAAFAIFVLFAQEVLGVGNVGYGVLLSIGATGAFLGSLVAGRTGQRPGTGRALLASVVLGGSPTWASASAQCCPSSGLVRTQWCERAGVERALGVAAASTGTGCPAGTRGERLPDPCLGRDAPRSASRRRRGGIRLAAALNSSRPVVPDGGARRGTCTQNARLERALADAATTV